MRVRRTTGFPPMALDGSGKRRVQWGPRLTSGSGSPSWTTPEATPTTRVVLPAGTAVLLAVEIDGELQREDADYLVVGRTLVFGRELVRESTARYVLRRLRSPRRHGGRRGDRIDVWLGSADAVEHVRGLPAGR